MNVTSILAAPAMQLPYQFSTPKFTKEEICKLVPVFIPNRKKNGMYLCLNALIKRTNVAKLDPKK